MINNDIFFFFDSKPEALPLYEMLEEKRNKDFQIVKGL